MDGKTHFHETQDHRPVRIHRRLQRLFGAQSGLRGGFPVHNPEVPVRMFLFSFFFFCFLLFITTSVCFSNAGLSCLDKAADSWNICTHTRIHARTYYELCLWGFSFLPFFSVFVFCQLCLIFMMDDEWVHFCINFNKFKRVTILKIWIYLKIQQLNTVELFSGYQIFHSLDLSRLDSKLIVSTYKNVTPQPQLCYHWKYSTCFETLAWDWKDQILCFCQIVVFHMMYHDILMELMTYCWTVMQYILWDSIEWGSFSIHEFRCSGY